MSYKKIMFLIGLWVIFLVPGAGVSQTEKEAPPKTPEAKVTTAKQPESDFQKARENFLKKDFKASAEAIRRGVTYLASPEGRAEEGREKTFLASQEELRRLAERVEKGSVKSVKELNRALARGSHGLAKYHYLKATESWAKKETAKAGQELDAASTYLASGVKQAEGKVKRGVEKVIEDTHLLAEKLKQGTGWVDTEAEKGIQALGKEIDKLGKKVKAPKKS